jgi:hypothetical protein
VMSTLCFYILIFYLFPFAKTVFRTYLDCAVSHQAVTTEAWVYGYDSPYVRFVVDEVALGQLFFCVCWFSSFSIIPPMLCMH